MSKFLSQFLKRFANSFLLHLALAVTLVFLDYRSSPGASDAVRMRFTFGGVFDSALELERQIRSGPRAA